MKQTSANAVAYAPVPPLQLKQENAQLGIMFMLFTTLIFAAQDGISQYLASQYNVPMVIMVRYWFFALFVIAFAARKRGGLKKTAKTSHFYLQMFRGILLVLETCVMILGFVKLGLIESHAVFAAYPLLVAMLSGPVLGEKLGWRRWTAIAIGTVGMMIILQPGSQVFSIEALIPLLAALMFAFYQLLTRYVSRKDHAQTSFFYTGVGGCLGMTIIGLFFLQPILMKDWGWMLALCVMGTIGHFTLIKALEVAEAATVQPFAFFQMVFASAIGFVVFSETLEAHVILGAAIVVSAGIFTILRSHKKAAAG